LFWGCCKSAISFWASCNCNFFLHFETSAYLIHCISVATPTAAAAASKIGKENKKKRLVGRPVGLFSEFKLTSASDSIQIRFERVSSVSTRSVLLELNLTSEGVAVTMHKGSPSPLSRKWWKMEQPFGCPTNQPNDQTAIRHSFFQNHNGGSPHFMSSRGPQKMFTKKGILKMISTMNEPKQLTTI
jgi:hypothetical protein